MLHMFGVGLQVTENYNALYEKMVGRTVEILSFVCFRPTDYDRLCIDFFAYASVSISFFFGWLVNLKDLVLYCIDYGLPYEPGLPLWQEGAGAMLAAMEMGRPYKPPTGKAMTSKTGTRSTRNKGSNQLKP